MSVQNHQPSSCRPSSRLHCDSDDNAHASRMRRIDRPGAPELGLMTAHYRIFAGTNEEHCKHVAAAFLAAEYERERRRAVRSDEAAGGPGMVLVAGGRALWWLRHSCPKPSSIVLYHVRELCVDGLLACFPTNGTPRGSAPLSSSIVVTQRIRCIIHPI